ncbi:peptidase inhibitor 16-like [Clarias gariepinus]
MIWKTALHLARCWIVLSLVSGQLTEEQKDQIVALHNHYRSVVSPKAADMLHMTWNDTLSSIAEGYAALCIWNHNPAVRNILGENLFLTTGHLNINRSMAAWFDEYKDYVYANQTCKNICGHYTQMVWAKSNRVGCASHFCKTVEGSTYNNTMIVVCNYFPPGNVEGVQPYEAGDPCSKCPEEMTGCIENTCREDTYSGGGSGSGEAPSTVYTTASTNDITPTTPGSETEDTTTDNDDESTTEESSVHLCTRDTTWMGPVDAAAFTKLSLGTLLLSGLMVSFIF